MLARVWSSSGGGTTLVDVSHLKAVMGGIVQWPACSEISCAVTEERGSHVRMASAKFVATALKEGARKPCCAVCHTSGTHCLRTATAAARYIARHCCLGAVCIAHYAHSFCMIMCCAAACGILGIVVLQCSWC